MTRLLMALALALLSVASMAGAQTETPTSTPTETPTDMPTQTPTPTPTPTPCAEYACTGTVMAADFAACPILALRNGDTCMLGDGFTRTDLEIRLYEGTLNFNSQDFTAANIDYGVATGPVTLDMTDSLVSLQNGYGGTTTQTITTGGGGTSTLTMLGGNIAPHAFPLHNVVLDGANTIGNLVAGLVTITPNSTVSLGIGYIQAPTITCAGTGGQPIVITSDHVPEFGMQKGVMHPGTLVVCEHTTVTNIGCDTTIPCIARNSTDGGGNVGWCFGDVMACPAVTWTPTPAPQTPTNTNTPTNTPDDPACCQLADGTAAGHPGSTCVDNVWSIGVSLPSIQWIGGCEVLAGFFPTTVTTDGIGFGVNCMVPGDLGSTCVVPGGVTHRRRVVRRYGRRRH